jgi:hypothetical protein
MSKLAALRKPLSLLVVLAGIAVAIVAGPGSAEPTRSTGLFVLGDVTAANATATDTVTWWSHSWWLANSLTKGPAPAAFKGFATDFSSDAPTCGDTWTTGPGNSPHPPDDVSGVITVLVSDAITKSGDTISGNIVKVVQVATDPGYGPNPGHPGTGRIVSTLCDDNEPE